MVSVASAMSTAICRLPSGIGLATNFTLPLRNSETSKPIALRSATSSVDDSSSSGGVGPCALDDDVGIEPVDRWPAPRRGSRPATR